MGATHLDGCRMSAARLLCPLLPFLAVMLARDLEGALSTILGGDLSVLAREVLVPGA
jgi:hypothetical protein